MRRDRLIQTKLQELIDEKVAPGIQLALGYKDQCLGVYCAGYRDPQTKVKLRESSLFDLASLTKVISTVSLVLLLRQKGGIPSLQEKIHHWLPSLNSDLKERTLLDLLNHRAGLPKIFEHTEELHDSRDDRWRFFIDQIDAQYKAGSSEVVYSDVGYMILGRILELASGKRLRDLFLENLGAPDQLVYGPVQYPLQFLSRFFDIPNVVSSWSLGEPSFKMRGLPQDPRAQWLGGDAGHAGLFGCAEAVESWGRELWVSYHGKGLKFSDRILRELLDSDPNFIRFRGGFDTPTPPSQAGSLVNSSTVIGHLGYTGTSFWMDLERGWRITLLSHRHAPQVDPARLSQFRPQFHDWILEEIFTTL